MLWDVLLSSLNSKPDPEPDANPGPEVRDWDKIKTSLASKASSALTSQPWYDKVDSPLNQLRLFAVAILAAVLEPEKMRSNNPGPAIDKAARLLDRVPEYLRFENLSRVQQRDRLSKEATERKQLVRLWKMDKGLRFTLEQFIGTPSCKHKSLRELKLMLERVEFPFLETPKKPFPFWPAGQITAAAYQHALKQNAKLRQKQRLLSQQKRRIKRL
jgi:hypothetical protein